MEAHTHFNKRTGLKIVLEGNQPEMVDAVRSGRGHSNTGACWRWLVSLALYASSLGLGMAISVLGPTFEDLAINVNKNISNLSYIFVGRSSGYAGGSLLGGILFDCVNSHLLLGFSLLITSFGMFGTPFCKQAWLLTALVSSVGMSMGVIDTGGNVLILNTWGEQAGPHMQALHFSFAAGAFASPIIAKLLFGQKKDPSMNSTTYAPPLSVSSSKTILPFSHPKINIISSMWAYIVIGAFVLLVSLLFFILYFSSPPISNRVKTASGKPLFSKHHNTLIFLLSMFFFFYVGGEVAYGSFIFTYAKVYAGMDEAQAAGLNSVFWGTFAAGRGLAIFFATCLHPGTLILLSVVCTTVSSLLLMLLSRSNPVLWICTALYGLSMSTIFPSGISWLEQYTKVTGRSASVFVVGAALGEMALPALLGFLLGRVHKQPLLMYLAFGTSIFTSILFLIMYKLASRGRDSYIQKVLGKHTTDNSEYCQALLDNMEELEELENIGETNQFKYTDDASLANSTANASVSSDVAATAHAEQSMGTSADPTDPVSKTFLNRED
ncbi:sodium-dependent glucose transporter 1-like [Xyrauchen texanus]|uniref:sodium-dependent glucose transporter 1-like n=1 Tax=Xyrauchen texanus TaxID=154827 RepID=UPI0022428E35|nr:sodium-dependent glucose transporter 1-like [Xyrauchen texanus]